MVQKIAVKNILYIIYVILYQKSKRYVLRAIIKKKILSVKFYKILSTYNAKIKIILYTFLKFDNKN
jgi:hypothetical protein